MLENELLSLDAQIANLVKELKEKEDEMEKASSCKLPYESENMS